MPPLTHHRISVLVVSLLAIVGLSACGDGATSDTGAGGTAAPAARSPKELRLGFFPNITHATALVGVKAGIFEKHLDDIKLKTSTFNAGPAAVEALFSGALDATYVGPNPAVNAFVKSNGQAVRIVAGATSGGAFLVVKPGIDDPAELKGKKLATPQLGNTQDVALRSFLKKKGLSADVQGGGDVAILPQENAQTLDTFRQGQIDGAWVPEPWATRLVLEGGGRVLVDERDLWPEGRFVTTHLIVRTEFLKKHPAAVKRLLEAHVEATTFVNANAERAKRLVNEAIADRTGKALSQETIDGAWGNLIFTSDPVAASLRRMAEDARAVGLLEKADLDRIYALELLNEVLEANGTEPVDAR